MTTSKQTPCETPTSLLHCIFCTPSCWMSVDDGVIWAFAAPVLMVILVKCYDSEVHNYMYLSSYMSHGLNTILQINGFILAITVASVVRVRKSSKKVTTSHLIV